MISYARVAHNPPTIERRNSWLSLTPEPEDALPRAIAALRAGAEPSPAAVAAERDRVELLVVRGRRRAWRRWLRETRDLARHAAERQPHEARIVLDVIENHDALSLGLARRGRRAGRGRKRR
jgi:hypothetical protein